MLDHSDLLRHDVQLLAHLHADLDQGLAVVRADALRFGQLVTDFDSRQRRIKRKRPRIDALVIKEVG
ncbi:hypothetical protein MAFF211471_13310 [Ralstonia solanacearum]|nr:hypothetical protein MAFF211471_13310 [Ralstonia solanacearum]BCM98797.1 hypothetical protein RPSA_13340 [Ralstonia solanacearum]